MRQIVLSFLLICCMGIGFAQQIPIKKLIKASEVVSFAKSFDNPALSPNQSKPELQLRRESNEPFNGIVNLKRTFSGKTEIIGNDKNDPTGTFSLTIDKDGIVSGSYFSTKNKEAQIYSTDPATGKLIVEKDNISKYLCSDYIQEKSSDENYPPKSSKPVPILESLPSAQAVIYLDFDGETSTSRWNGGRTIVAKSFNYSDAVIEKHWKITAEDFRPFDVNVTTNRATYDRAPKNKRIMCIITPTKTAAPGAGGVAYLNSFADGRNDPCWVFISDQTKGSGEVASHEVGHTLGLGHDGSHLGAYYQGHNGWGPIMGACHRLETVHWSKGEYRYANNPEDDLQIMATRNGFGYRKDEVGDDIGSAKDIVASATGDVEANKNHFIIEKPTDKDVFKIMAGKKGVIDLKVESFDHHPNLDVKVRLLDETGKEIEVFDSDNEMSGKISSEVEAGTYFVEIDGTGRGDLITGYSEYGSLGTFYLSGKIPAGGGELPKAKFSSNKQVVCAGQEVSFKDESSGSPNKWEWKFENGTPETSDKQNPKVTYSKPGKHKVELKVTNSSGSNTIAEENYITVSEPKAIPVKEDFEKDFPGDGWSVENPDGDITWEKSTKTGVGSKSCLSINNADYKKVGEKDYFTLPELDLSIGSGNDPLLSFFVAYTRFNNDAKDKLKVHISDDCGESWNEIYFKEQKELETKDVDFDESQDWIPEDEEDWRKEMIDLGKYKEKKSVIIKYESVNGYGNLIWIDNINIDFSSGNNHLEKPKNLLTLAPNPTNGIFKFSFISNQKDNYNFEIRNILGEVIYSKWQIGKTNSFSREIDLTKESNGIYFITVSGDMSTVTQKFIKQ